MDFWIKYIFLHFPIVLKYVQSDSVGDSRAGPGSRRQWATPNRRGSSQSWTSRCSCQPQNFLHTTGWCGWSWKYVAMLVIDDSHCIHVIYYIIIHIHYTYIYIYTHTYTCYIYIYTYIQMLYIYIHIHTHHIYIYICIYIYRNPANMSSVVAYLRKSEGFRTSRTWPVARWPIIMIPCRSPTTAWMQPTTSRLGLWRGLIQSMQ